MLKSAIYIDFDKTISPIHGFHEPPTQETVNAITELNKKYKIVIYSCRANTEICIESDYIKLVEYLHKHNIPYDKIVRDKPLYIAIIDDRAFNPTQVSWGEIVSKLM